MNTNASALLTSRDYFVKTLLLALLAITARQMWKNAILIHAKTMAFVWMVQTNTDASALPISQANIVKTLWMTAYQALAPMVEFA
jgi:hypothetical protein